MRKLKWQSIVSIAVVLATVAACNMQPFSQVHIKASPSFKASVGEHTFYLSEKLNTEKPQEQLGNNPKLQVYSYYPTGTCTHPNQERYLIQYKPDAIQIKKEVLEAWQSLPDTNGIITISNLNKGEQNLTSVKVSASLLESGTETINKLLSKLKNYNIKLHDIPMYVCMNISHLPNATMEGKVNLKATTTTATTSLTQDAPLKLSKNCELPNAQNHKYRGSIPGNPLEISENTKNTSSSTIKKTLADVINEKVISNGSLNKFELTGNIGITKLTVKKDELDAAINNNKQVEIQPVIFIELPIGIEITADKEIKLLEEHESLEKFKDKEIFGRTELWAADDKKRDFAKFLRSAKIVCAVHNTTGIQDITMILNLKPKNATPTDPAIITKQAAIPRDGNIVFEFNAEDRKNMMDNLLYPEIIIKTKKDSYIVNRNAAFKVNLSVRTDFDIDYIQSM